MSAPLSSRKPNFQGPAIVIGVEEAIWGAYTGSLTGFFATECGVACTDEAPNLPIGAVDENTKEAKSMAGTDESV